MPSPRDHHAVLAMQCKALGLPAPLVEYRFHESRLWRIDFFWDDARLGLEVEGVVYATERGDARLGGRHTSRRGFADDLEKYRAAFVLGISILRCLPQQVQDGSAILAIAARLNRGRIDTPTVSPTSDPCIAATRPPRKASRAATRRAWERALVDRGAGPDAAPARAQRRR